MAGQELYLQPILEGATEPLADMSVSMAAIGNQIEQSTRILSNILANTGIAQTQKAYSGSEFSALTLAAGTASKSYSESINHYASIYPLDFETIYLRASGSDSNINKSIDVTNLEQISFDIEVEAIAAGRGGYIATVFNGVDKYQRAVGTQHVEYDCSSLTGNINLKFIGRGASTDYPATIGKISNLRFDNEIRQEFCIYPNLAFSSNNLKLSNNKVVGNFDQAYGKVTIPNITGANMWNSCIINGKLDGVSMSIVDNTSGDKLLDLVGSLTDISTLPQLSNLAVKFEFGEGSENSYISAIIFRYY